MFQIHTDWPSYLRTKGIFFVKRENVGIPEPGDDDDENKTQYDLLDYLTCGDIYPNVLGIFFIHFIRWSYNHSLCFRPFLCLGGRGDNTNFQESKKHFKISSLCRQRYSLFFVPFMTFTKIFLKMSGDRFTNCQLRFIRFGGISRGKPSFHSLNGLQVT